MPTSDVQSKALMEQMWSNQRNEKTVQCQCDLTRKRKLIQTWAGEHTTGILLINRYGVCERENNPDRASEPMVC